MGVDVGFAGNFTVDETATTISDLVSREQAGRVGSNVVNDNGFTCRRSRPTDALIEWDAGVRRHGALEGAAALVCLCQQRLRKRRPSEWESQVLGANLPAMRLLRTEPRLLRPTHGNRIYLREAAPMESETRTPQPYGIGSVFPRMWLR